MLRHARHHALGVGPLGADDPIGGLNDEIHQRTNGQLACHLPRGCATHAVRNDQAVALLREHRGRLGQDVRRERRQDSVETRDEKMILIVGANVSFV